MHLVLYSQPDPLVLYSVLFQSRLEKRHLAASRVRCLFESRTFIVTCWNLSPETNMPSKTETYIPDQNNVTVTWLTNLSKLSQNDSSLGECLCHLKKHVTTCFFQKNWKIYFFFRFLQNPSPFFTWCVLWDPSLLPNLEQDPRYFFLLFILGFNHVARLDLVVHVKTDIHSVYSFQVLNLAVYLISLQYVQWNWDVSACCLSREGCACFSWVEISPHSCLLPVPFCILVCIKQML